jgi:ABC-2 type transport system ATP-binding protein
VTATIPVIAVDGLAKTYGSVAALKGISFTIEPGEVFGLLGPDGAGKSSLMQILAGVLRPNGGSATVAGQDVIAQPEAVKSRIGFMPQGLGLNLYDSLSVLEII